MTRVAKAINNIAIAIYISSSFSKLFMSIIMYLASATIEMYKGNLMGSLPEE